MISYLEEIENTYLLGKGIHPTQIDKLYRAVKEYLEDNNLKKKQLERKEKMLSDKIDVASFMVWFFENYPTSLTTMKDNPDFQYTFK